MYFTAFRFAAGKLLDLKATRSAVRRSTGVSYFVTGVM
jgi:hypothetical protein